MMHIHFSLPITLATALLLMGPAHADPGRFIPTPGGPKSRVELAAQMHMGDILPPKTQHAVGIRTADWPDAILVGVNWRSLSLNGQEILNLMKEDDPRNPGQSQQTIPQANQTTGEPQKRGRLIIPLFEAAEEEMQRLEARIKRSGEKSRGKGVAILYFDASIPLQTLYEVIYTLGQAQYSGFFFVVDNPNPIPWDEHRASIGADVVAPLNPLSLSLVITHRGITIHGADPVVYPNGVPQVVEGEPRPTTVPCHSKPCTQVSDYDWTELTRWVSAIKRRHPAQQHINMISDSTVKPEVIWRTMGTAWNAFPCQVIVGGGMPGRPSTQTSTQPAQETVAQTRRGGVNTKNDLLPGLYFSLPVIGPPHPGGLGSRGSGLGGSGTAGGLGGIPASPGGQVNLTPEVPDGPFGPEGHCSGHGRILGSLRDGAELDGVFGSSNLNSDLQNGIGGLIGARGTQIGKKGLGDEEDEEDEEDEGFAAASARAQTTGGVASIGGDSIILGALDKSLIDHVIKRHMNQIAYCYQRELADKPTLGGKITVKFVIAKDGSVSRAATKKSTMGSPAVESCLNQRFRRFKFPEPKDGGTVIVTIPFIFAPD
jgi:TonB family protein